jgi:hypothetical protein
LDIGAVPQKIQAWSFVTAAISETWSLQSDSLFTLVAAEGRAGKSVVPLTPEFDQGYR